jgi:biopolymer transport protein ExbB/TolQ
MQFVTQVLNFISNSLLLPVMLALLVALFAAIVVAIQLLKNSVGRPKFRRELALLQLQGLTVLDNCVHIKGRISLYQTMQNVFNDMAWKIEPILSEFDCKRAKDLEMAKMICKVGPMLGLMGTLIPMGPALTSLATGDIATMAANLQIAFATTVVGILVGAIGFVVLTVEQRWAAEEVVALEIILNNREKEHA